ncbi:AraC family transcriptional regulator [Paenibacillus radicis (ex Gao et al. 2016)]|uniref:HTH araC/xylS-type domain-containing protein n=1 Tax=Paenibacillus radicis (ex Gao et al. 2016) TaxID=1737354 RepID=A0A917LWD7_9BACL|nr:AraC family transcriptional regulator [Paenibacillus radicis (ex Gao et al. 2016)]GGG61169.1 hypothetical protein GCM10010918_13230 [Paenibacillus radicis (ex Gao et al. 2016)]
MRRLLPKKTYIRNFLIIGILFTIIILLFSYLLRQQYANQAYDDVNHLMEIKTTSVSQSFEYQLDHLRAYALTIYQDPEIFNWLMSEDGDPLVMSSALKSVSKFMSLQSFIDSTYLVNMKLEKVIHSRDGIHTFTDFMDQDMLDQLQHHPPSTLRFFNHTNKTGSYLALIAPAYYSKVASQGYIVILLDKSLLEKYLLQNLNDSTTSIMVLDGDQNVILGGSDDLDVKQLITQNAQVNDNNRYLIHSHAFNIEDWKLYSTVKVKDISKNIDKIMFRMYGMCFFLLLILSALTYWNSRRQFMPISQLAGQIRKTVATGAANAEQSSNSEFAIIKTGVDHMVKTMEEMNSMIRNHQEVVKNEVLRQWLLQGTYNNAIQELGNGNVSQLLAGNIRLAVIRINRFQSFSERYAYASRKLLLYAMGNIAGETLGNQGFVTENVDLGSDHLVILIGGGTADQNPAPALEEARLAIDKWLHIQVTAAVSHQTAIDENMRSLYDRVCDLTLLRFFETEEKVYVEGDLGDYLPERQWDLDESRIQKLIQAVRKSQKEQVREQLDLIFGQLQSLPYSECQFQLKLLFFYIVKAFNKVMGEQEQGGVDLLLQKFDTLMDVRDWLDNQFMRLIDNVAQSHTASNRKEELAAEIFDYVKRHLHDPMLTLESIADYLVLSVSYVRLVFKETYLITLSGFIHQERLEQAKQLLVSTDWPVLDIAERSGFQSKTTFFTSFKKYTGLTPNQFREQNSNTGTDF